MNISIDEKSGVPIYKQLVGAVTGAIDGGELADGARLPTVREFADTIGIARGTVKHAYDTLEALGYVEMTQGRGTFVRSKPSQEGSRKEQAMVAIDAMYSRLEALDFTTEEIQIFLNLKLRAREQTTDDVRVALVDCNPEALASVARQLSEVGHMDYVPFLLDDIVASPERLEDGFDLYVTTVKHVGELAAVLPDGGTLLRIVLSETPETVSKIAKIPPDAVVGAVCESRRFSVVMRRACDAYGRLEKSPKVFFFGNLSALRHCDVILLPPDYLRYCSVDDERSIMQMQATGHETILFDYRIDRGSLIYLGEQVSSIYLRNKNRYARINP